ncbi:hypothetical protein [Fluviicola taffensis]|uniref:hypothetical protein n=1 Tax=Fluviicola taffensis TaxID=191579 RepID=UPI0031380562
MKNVTKLLLLLSIIAIGFSSCSKEKRIEKHLYSKSGKWNNTLYDYKYYYNGVQESSIVYQNAGYIEFEKDGKFTWVFTADGSTDASSGTWSNTEDKLTLVEPGNTVIYTILEESKKTLKLEYSESSTEFGDEKETYTLTFEKEK